MTSALSVNPLGTINRTPFDPQLTFMARLPQHADLADLSALPRGAARKQAVFNRLMDTAGRTQGPVLDAVEGLAHLGDVTRVERLYSPNMVVVSADDLHDVDTVLKALYKAGVQSVYRATDGSLIDDPSLRVGKGDVRNALPGSSPVHGHVPAGPGAGTDDAVELDDPSAVAPGPGDWDITSIGAPEAWRQGATGAGLVYGSIDTGVDGSHPALAGSYRGQHGARVVQDHNWYDMGDDPSPVPRDYRWHGTHTTGSVVGATKAGAFGVAPGAKWISVAGMTPKDHDVLNLLRAVQWMQAPTRRDGTDPEAGLAPDVVGMSWWAAPANEDLFHDSVRDLAAAGIVPVKSMGNQGPGPETGTSPGQFPEVYTVNAVDPTGAVPPFASRGPSAWHAPGQQPPPKPDFGAPGTAIRSSMPGGLYGTWSGTSMAQPHLSGVILDVLSRYPQLTDAQLRQALDDGARDVGAPGRDNETGMGVVDLPRTLAAAARILATTGQDAPAPPAGQAPTA